MAEETEISWCDHTWNPWRGCVKLSAGCAHCYAETLSKRNPAVLGVWGKDAARVEAVESYWMQPLRWHKAAVKAGEIRTVFVGSMMDVGEDRRDLDPLRDRLMAMIALTPLQRGANGQPVGLRYLLLTKRPGALKRYLDAPGLFDRVYEEADRYRTRRPALCNVPIGDLEHGHRAAWFPHLWIGASVEDQRAADERIPELLSIDCAGHFLSMEPLLGAVDPTAVRFPKWAEAPDDWRMNALTGQYFDDSKRWAAKAMAALDWVIVGGESGPNARPMHPEWARSLRDQCQKAGVPYHFKQWGSLLPQGQGEPGRATSYGHLLTPDGQLLTLDEAWKAGEPDGVLMAKMDKHAAGRLLDGRIWDEKPAVTHG